MILAREWTIQPSLLAPKFLGNFFQVFFLTYPHLFLDTCVARNPAYVDGSVREEKEKSVAMTFYCAARDTGRVTLGLSVSPPAPSLSLPHPNLFPLFSLVSSNRLLFRLCISR